MKTNYKKGSAVVWIIVLVIIILGAGFLIMRNKNQNGEYQPTTSPNTNMDSGYQSSESLNEIDAEIDSIGADLNGIDVENIDK